MADLETMRKEAHARLPGYMVPGLLGYIERGEPVGDFLSALLSNDLRGTFERADDTNQQLVGVYLRFLYNFAPAGSWGSKERFENWQGLERIGLVGRKSDECGHCGGDGIEPAGMSFDAGDGEGEDRPCSVCCS